jgi:TolB-like protein/Tfp pilus assembly protein PilF
VADPSPDAVQVGRLLGKYRLVAPIGAGGMGEVFRAHDQGLDRDVAVKILPSARAVDEAARNRFRKEALALSKLNHPSIATIFDFGTLEGVDYLVMELVEGETLAARIGSQPLTEKEIAALGAQIADALEEAHEHGVVHRDLKPANVVVTAKGRAKVLDFGLARLLRAPGATDLTASLTATPAAAGTLPYMAPEQLQGEEADARSDIYALGCVLYEMATGQRAFREELSTRLVDAILHRPPVAPRARNERVSAELERIVLKCLEKEPGLRYQSARELAVDLRRLATPSAVAAVPLEPEAPSLEARRWRTPALVGFGLLAFLLLAGLIVGWNLVRARGGPSALGAVAIQSLAVLPLENLSHDPAQDYFADGMTEELTANLAQIGSLRVISRTSVMQYKGTRKTMPEIGRELNVDALVEGSVLRAGQRVRITAQLIRASQDQHLWARSYEGDLGDVLALQSTVAREIAGEIRAALTPQDQARLATARKVDPEAYEAYLRGRHEWELANGANLRSSLEYYKQALAKDPNYALAYAGMADSYAMLSDFYLPPREVMPKATEAAVKAIELDDSLAQAHNALASIHFIYDWDWPGAEREWKRAIELNPNFADAHHLYGEFLFSMRRPEEGATELRRAEQLAPFSGQVYVSACNSYWLDHKYNEAFTHCRAGLRIDPQNAYLHITLGLALASNGQFEEAIREGETATRIDESRIIQGFLGAIYAQAGKRAEAKKIRDTLQSNLAEAYVCPYEIGTISLLLGNKDEAFRWIEKAIEFRSVCIPYLWTDPRLDSLRSDPRYDELVRRLKFPQ